MAVIATIATGKVIGRDVASPPTRLLWYWAGTLMLGNKIHKIYDISYKNMIQVLHKYIETS